LDFGPNPELLHCPPSTCGSKRKDIKDPHAKLYSKNNQGTEITTFMKTQEGVNNPRNERGLTFFTKSQTKKGIM
jgi:hypothetical protein